MNSLKKEIKDNFKGVVYNSGQYYNALATKNLNDQDDYAAAEFHFSMQINKLLGDEKYENFLSQLSDLEDLQGCTRGFLAKIMAKEGFSANAEAESLRCLGVTEKIAEKLIDEMFE
jgi:hypothetical protein